MSVNKKSREQLKKAGTYAFSVLCGMTASGLLVLMFSVVMYVLGLPPEIAGVLSLVSFAAGCFLAGFVCGSIKRRGGLKSGLLCALIMTAAVALGSAVTGGFSGNDALIKLITAAVASCTGSVCGVNRK